jgi:hypothetical protein
MMAFGAFSGGPNRNEWDMIAESGNEDSHASRYRFNCLRAGTKSSNAAAPTGFHTEPGIPSPAEVRDTSEVFRRPDS